MNITTTNGKSRVLLDPGNIQVHLRENPAAPGITLIADDLHGNNVMLYLDETQAKRLERALVSALGRRQLEAALPG